MHRPRIALEVDGVQARLLATEAGLAIMDVFLPPYAGPAPTSSLRPLRLAVPPPTTECGLVAPSPDAWTPAVKAFAASLRAATGGAPAAGDQAATP